MRVDTSIIKNKFNDNKVVEILARPIVVPKVFEEDFDRMSKANALSRRNALINAAQINNQCDNINEYAAQGLAKLFMAQAVHEKQ